MKIDVTGLMQLPLMMAPSATVGGNPPEWMNIPYFVIPLVLFYFVLIRPQMRRQKETEKLIGSVNTGDRVVAAGGICGTVANLKDQIVVLKVADNVKIEVLRSSITSVEKPTEEKSAA